MQLLLPRLDGGCENLLNMSRITKGLTVETSPRLRYVVMGRHGQLVTTMP